MSITQKESAGNYGSDTGPCRKPGGYWMRSFDRVSNRWRPGVAVKMKVIILLVLHLPQLSLAIEKADMVLVIKSESKLYLKRKGTVFREFHVAFGENPKGHKQQQGDERTPEGFYHLDLKKKDSAYYKSIRLSYPNERDKQRARQLGVNPGGWIMIHGQKNGFGHLAPITQRYNWTDGCIAVTNEEMEDIWQAVDVGTPIEIRP